MQRRKDRNSLVVGRGALGRRKSECNPPPGYYEIGNKDQMLFHRSQGFRMVEDLRQARSSNVSREKEEKEKEEGKEEPANLKHVETRKMLEFIGQLHKGSVVGGLSMALK